MAREDDPYHPQTDAERRATSEAAARRDPTLAPDAHPEAAAPGQGIPDQTADSPSSGAHAAVEAPGGRGKVLWGVVAAVIAVALAFWLLGGAVEEADVDVEAEDAGPEAVVVIEDGDAEVRETAD